MARTAVSFFLSGTDVSPSTGQKKIHIASDHAGFPLKVKVKSHLKGLGYLVHDHGPADESRVDYPDYADALCSELQGDEMGILICGSGQGMVMRANKYPGLRAALCHNTEICQLAREHNDANVLCLGARFLKEDRALGIVDQFLSTSFSGGRHTQRVEKIGAPLKNL